jgi:hypothetical protein
MKNTQTPFDTKVAILTHFWHDYKDETDDSELSELVQEYKSVFALALCIKVGQAIPTEAGIEILNRFFDDVCEIQGITEDVAIKDYYDFIK